MHSQSAHAISSSCLRKSHLDKVVDPAGGSYYIGEPSTVPLAQEAWKLFIDIEDKGGFLACINDGSIQKTVSSETSAKRHTM